MSLKIDLGLFNLDIIDYHAILGVPVDADPKDIRKQYLKVARRLHPDSFSKDDEVERQSAAELLSKLVNPAWEKLSQEKNYKEHCLLLELKGQQASRQQETIMLVSESARRLAGAAGAINVSYHAALRQLIEKQYEHLDRSLEIIGHISELNLVYLMRSAGDGKRMSAPTQVPAANASGTPGTRGTPGTPGTGERPKTPRPPETPTAPYIRRALDYVKKQEYPKAIIELRDGINVDPSCSSCHAHLAGIYLRTGQLTMAKVHVNQALKLNPKDPVALEGLKKLEQAGVKVASQTSGKPAAKDGKNASGGGLFGLFGGKKK
jgi:tetratricopeptide (TPR) repeat protein